MKSHKAARSRFKVTATGKVVAWKSGKRHLNWKKSGKSIRQKGRPFAVAEAEARKIRNLLLEE